MESFTTKADDLYKEASEIELPVYIPPYTSCYETLYQEEELIEEARRMEQAARDIRKRFHEIANSGFLLPDSTLLRKAVVSVKRGKLSFSHEQLKQVVFMLMVELPYLLFRPKSETKNYIILIFWSTSVEESGCEIQKKAKVFQEEVAAEYQFRFKVENAPAPKRQILYLINNYKLVHAQSDENSHLQTEDHNQLVSFFAMLEQQNIMPQSKKRKAEEPVAKTLIST